MGNLPTAVAQLVQKFAEHADHYKSPAYNETLCRIDLINPLLALLGWDVENKKAYADAYREVYHEDAVKVGSATKAPDYSFRIGGQRKFFLEAKKPGRDLKNDPEPAYQLRRYAWSAKLPLSILTDFEEFAVYDGRVEPSVNDKAATARIFYCRYDQLADPHKDHPSNWDWIVSVFSPDAIQKGSFDKYAQAVKGKRGTAEVDVAFLREIETWREILAKAFARENTLSQRDLNFAVQRTIDRIIFLRICEDRGIEPYGQLAALSNGVAVYPRLNELFRRGDEKYNSGIFHFHKEKDRHEPPDELTPTLLLDDKPLKEILKNLYYPKSPYEFSVLSADILGQVYEQFLGKVIRLTSDHRAVVEEKPEVRKAGGVYYTPTYIVDYIVQNTVGKLLEGKTPKDAAKLKILDPACGSGSFLIGAYQHLLDWHTGWYAGNDPQKHATGKNPAVYHAKGNTWRLTINKRKQILLNNIFGVDIDPQAVETTKLSLLLKVLEGESQQSLDNQMKLFRERALPDLGDNIKCGNSLIGPDFYDNAQMMMLGEEEKFRVNVFDWEKEFTWLQGGKHPKFRGGLAGTSTVGFDAIIGNPPYVRSINLKKSNPVEWEHYRQGYAAAADREWDIYLLFVEKAMALLDSRGHVSFILPNKFLNSQAGTNLRGMLAAGQHLEALVHFGAYQIFQDATTYTCLLFLTATPTSKADVARYDGPVGRAAIGGCPMPEVAPELWKKSVVQTSLLANSAWNFAGGSASVFARLAKLGPLAAQADIFQGTGTRADRVYFVTPVNVNSKIVRVYSEELDEEVELEQTFLKSAWRGRNIDRYHAARPSFLIVPYTVTEFRATLVPESELSRTAPLTMRYLRRCKQRLNDREDGRFDGDEWFCYGRPQNMTKFGQARKIVLPDVAIRGAFHLDVDKTWLLDTCYGIVMKPQSTLDIRFILAVLNSKVLTAFLQERGTPLRGGYFRMKTAYLNPFPIPDLNLSDRSGKQAHDTMVAFVDQMRSLQKSLANAKTPHAQDSTRRQIDALDIQIDRLVYQLYDLTDAEIAIVESAAAKP